MGAQRQQNPRNGGKHVRIFQEEEEEEVKSPLMVYVRRHNSHVLGSMERTSVDFWVAPGSCWLSVSRLTGLRSDCTPGTPERRKRPFPVTTTSILYDIDLILKEQINEGTQTNIFWKQLSGTTTASTTTTTTRVQHTV